MTLRSLAHLAFSVVAAVLFLAFARPAAAQTMPGECPPENVGGPVRDLGEALRAAAAVDGSCAAAVGRLDLSRVKNLVREAGCKDGGPCTIKMIIDEMAKEQGLPADLLYAVAWTETNWIQWRDNGKPVISTSGDIGLFQVNRSWKRTYDLDQLGQDMLYNARAASKILKWSYDYAKSKGKKGEDLYRSAYAIYNGGPAALNRPWRPRDPASSHDRNFKKYNRRKPWTGPTKTCSA